MAAPVQMDFAGWNPHAQTHTFRTQTQRYIQTHTTQKHRDIHKHAYADTHIHLVDSVLTLCFLILFSGILPLSSKWPHQLSPFVPLLIASLPSLESNVHHYNYSIDTISKVSRGSLSCSWFSSHIYITLSWVICSNILQKVLTLNTQASQNTHACTHTHTHTCTHTCMHTHRSYGST